MNLLVETLARLHPSLGTLSGVTLAIFLLVLVLTGLFFIGYAVKGTQVVLQLSKAIKGIKSSRKDGKAPKPSSLSKYFGDEPLRHLWEEYTDTVYEMKYASNSQQSLVEVRATVPSETLFTREVLVDSRLFDDFTKHLPGVLTGLGIIGTFAGLLEGLGKFDPSSTASAVSGLRPLLDGVSHAFVASGTAIGCAMVVVFVSRLVLAYCYRLVENLSHGIDSLYSTGAGEEYLARLVKATEQSEANTAQLKDALVEDLRKMMQELVERQIVSHQAATKELGVSLANTISSVMAEPIQKMTEAINTTTTNNGAQVSGMLESLLTGFMAKLEDTFGGQMRGINDQMQRSMEVMTSVQAALQELLADIKRTNEQASNTLTGTLEEAMKKAADNQRVLIEQMREFVQEFKKLVEDERSKSKQALDDAMSKVLADLSAAIKNMEAIRAGAAQAEGERQVRLTEGTNILFNNLSSQINELLKAVADQVTKTQQNIHAISDVSTRAVDGMNQGALTMASAADRFHTAGNSVTGVIEKTARLSESLTSAAAALQSSAQAVHRGFEQYENTRKTVDSQVTTLMGLIESAKKEAGVSKELIESIEASAAALKNAESQSREHLEQVNSALVEAFNQFGSALVEQVRKSVKETDAHMAAGMGQLSGVVQGLVQAVQRMTKA
ncbi:MAG: anti-phage defense ZorAB system ZorA [Burkholderiales bacterium]|nr:anti-phage defense ZorAB system ZorA [Burkholderiales bacterium]